MAVLLLAAGLALLWSGEPVRDGAMRFLRSQTAAYATFGPGAVWFLYEITQLGQADFGAYKIPLLVIFGAVAFLSFSRVNEFLSVRGLSVLILMGAGVMLDAAFGLYEIPQRLFLVSAIYALILVALYLGAWPYRLRDFFNWLWEKGLRPRVLGAALAGYGALLMIVSFTY